MSFCFLQLQTHAAEPVFEIKCTGINAKDQFFLEQFKAPVELFSLDLTDGSMFGPGAADYICVRDLNLGIKCLSAWPLHVSDQLSKLVSDPNFLGVRKEIEINSLLFAYLNKPVLPITGTNRLSHYTPSHRAVDDDYAIVQSETERRFNFVTPDREQPIFKHDYWIYKKGKQKISIKTDNTHAILPPSMIGKKIKYWDTDRGQHYWFLFETGELKVFNAYTNFLTFEKRECAQLFDGKLFRDFFIVSRFEGCGITLTGEAICGCKSMYHPQYFNLDEIAQRSKTSPIKKLVHNDQNNVCALFYDQHYECVDLYGGSIKPYSAFKKQVVDLVASPYGFCALQEVP